MELPPTLRKIRALGRFLYPNSGATENERQIAAQQLEVFWERFEQEAPPQPDPPQADSNPLQPVVDAWAAQVGRPPTKKELTAFEQFHRRGLSAALLLQAVEIAMRKLGADDPDKTLRYFCGIAWRWVREPESRPGGMGR